GLDNALLLINVVQQSGMSGSATFTFDDGTTLQSALILDTAFTGPWDTGPLETQIAGEAVTIANRIERTISVFDLVTIVGDGAPRRTAVNATLQPADTRSVPVGSTLDAA